MFDRRRLVHDHVQLPRVHQEVTDDPDTVLHLRLLEMGPARGHQILGDVGIETDFGEQVADQTGAPDPSLVIRGTTLEGEAQVVLLRALSGEGASPWEALLLHFSEGYLLLAEGRPLDAITALSKATQTDPRVLYWLARAREAAGQREEARELYAKLATWNAASLGHALVYEDAKRRAE